MIGAMTSASCSSVDRIAFFALAILAFHAVFVARTSSAYSPRTESDAHRADQHEQHSNSATDEQNDSSAPVVADETQVMDKRSVEELQIVGQHYRSPIESERSSGRHVQSVGESGPRRIRKRAKHVPKGLPIVVIGGRTNDFEDEAALEDSRKALDSFQAAAFSLAREETDDHREEEEGEEDAAGRDETNEDARHFERRTRIPYGLGIRLPSMTSSRTMARMEEASPWSNKFPGSLTAKAGFRRQGFSNWAFGGFGSCPRCCSWPASWKTSCRSYFNCFSC